MKLFKKDIKKIGYHIQANSDNNTYFICDGATSNLEQIILREILRLFGYKILSVRDHIWIDNNQKEQMDILIETDMPWEVYDRI